jgi:hypothetical protein
MPIHEPKIRIGTCPIHPSITFARVQSAVSEAMIGLENPGFCVKCGADAEGVEPDARGYECESCGERGVYGAEELLLMFVLGRRPMSAYMTPVQRFRLSEKLRRLAYELEHDAARLRSTHPGNANGLKEISSKLGAIGRSLSDGGQE